MLGDYDHDGITDLAVFEPGGLWRVLASASGKEVDTKFGTAAGDIPAPGIYGGNLTTQIAIYRPSTAQLIVMGGATTKIGTPNSGSVPLQADFTGDGKDDPAVFEPSTGTWRYISSNTGKEVDTVFGKSAGDIPVPRDYTGDGKADIAIFRPSTATATWLIMNSSTQTFGLKTDTPVPEPLQYLIGAVKPAVKTQVVKTLVSPSAQLAASLALVTIPSGSTSTPKTSSRRLSAQPPR